MNPVGIAIAVIFIAMLVFIIPQAPDLYTQQFPQQLLYFIIGIAGIGVVFYVLKDR